MLGLIGLLLVFMIGAAFILWLFDLKDKFK